MTARVLRVADSIPASGLTEWPTDVLGLDASLMVLRHRDIVCWFQAQLLSIRFDGFGAGFDSRFCEVLWGFIGEEITSSSPKSL